jgi:DNA-binding NarL/FixJ family response regulator
MNALHAHIEMVLLDDHPLVRRGLSTLFKKEFPHSHITECTTFHDFKLWALGKTSFLLMLDLTLSDGHGFDVLHWIKSQAIDCKICVFTMHNHPLYEQKCLQLGASAFLPKESSPEVIMTTLHHVLTYHESNKFVSLRKTSSSHFKTPEKYPLSPREIEVLEQLKKGFSSKEIAQLFELSVRTIEMYRANILRKLNVSNTAAAISLWIKENNSQKNLGKS